MVEQLDPAGWACSVDRSIDERVTVGHGGGGSLSAQLVEEIFLPAFGIDPDAELTDAATLPSHGRQLAFSTDSYVVRPLFFPGGCIADLAINGTVNDVAMRGAEPVALSAAFILEEGLEMSVLRDVAAAMGAAASLAGVQVVAGDTKVVGAGQADGLYITTAGIGFVRDGVDIRPRRARPGDLVLVNGDLGEHGVAVMSRREGLEFGTELRSDTAPLSGLVSAMIDGAGDRGAIHVLRDPTRGGLAAALCEIADTAGVGIRIEEPELPVPDTVAAACAFLGFDVLHVANEGKLVAIVSPEVADDVMGAMLDHEHGSGARIIGSVTDHHPGTVVCRTALGASRIVDRPLGEQLPRIC